MTISELKDQIKALQAELDHAWANGQGEDVIDSICEDLSGAKYDLQCAMEGEGK